MATRSWNRVELIGNVTRDPELRYTPSGAAVVTFSIATNRTFVSDGEKKEETDFHRCVAWNKLAELCSQLIKKGNRIFVSGRLQNRSWEQDGQTKYITEIVIEDMLLLTSKNSTGSDYTSEVPAEIPTRAAEEMPKPDKSEKSDKSEDQKIRKSDESDKSEESEESEKSEKPETSEKPEEAEEEEEKPKTAKKAETEDVDLDDLPF